MVLRQTANGKIETFAVCVNSIVHMQEYVTSSLLQKEKKKLGGQKKVTKL